LIKKEIIMFKKTLLCTALVAASGGAMAAATGSAVALIQSTEGAMGTLLIPTAPVAYTLGASYTQGDTVTLVWSQPLPTTVAHPPLTIVDQETFTDAAMRDATVVGLNPTADDVVVKDGYDTNLALDRAKVDALTTVAGLAALINTTARGTAFAATAFGTNSGLVLAGTKGTGSVAATLTGSFAAGAFTFAEVPAGNPIPLTVLSNTANAVTYRAGAVPAGFNYDGVKTINVLAVDIIGSGQADGTVVTQTFTAATSTGSAIDSGTPAVRVAEFHDQFMLEATKTAKQVDVEASRKKYVDDSGSSDAAVKAAAKVESVVGIAIKQDTTYGNKVTANKAGTMVAVLNDGTSGKPASIAKVNGNYSWLDKVSTVPYDIDATIGTIAPGYDALTHFADSVTINPVALGTAVTVATETNGITVLPTGVYSVDVTAKFAAIAGQKTKVFGNTSLGAWTLNGSNITAYGIPNQAAVTPFLWIQNAGVTAGEISGSVSCDGATIDLGSLGSAAGDTNTSVGAAVQDAVDAAGTCAVGSRYDATLTVNAKSSDITVTSGYKVADADGRNDRLGLETSDSL
jgi:hypothetical protein